jgi:hypothetical protein
VTKYVNKDEAIASSDVYEFLSREGLNHNIIKDEHGTLRWEPDPVINMLYEAGMIKLNPLADHIPNFKNDPRIRDLYRRMGYSVCGYWEVFHWEVNNELADEYEGN